MRKETKHFLDDLGRLFTQYDFVVARRGWFRFPIDQAFTGGVALGFSERSGNKLNVWLHGHLYSHPVDGLLKQANLTGYKKLTIPLVAEYFSGVDNFDVSAQLEAEQAQLALLGKARDNLHPEMMKLANSKPFLDSKINEPLVPPEVKVAYAMWSNGREYQSVKEVPFAFASEIEEQRALKFLDSL